MAFDDDKSPITLTYSLLGVWQNILKYLKLPEWYNLSRVSTGFHQVVHSCEYSDGRSINIFSELNAINPRIPIRFYIVEDNLWPKRHYRSETDGQIPLQESYKELWLILNINRNLQGLDFSGSMSNSTEKRPFGYSLFALLKHKSFDQLISLNLANSVFNCVHLEEISASLSQLKWLSVDNCTIYISKPQIRINFDRILRKRLVGYKHKLVTSGMKWFLVVIQESFPTLQLVSASETHFQSCGCIIYSYGQEDPKTVYKLQNLHHSQESTDQSDMDSDQNCSVS